MVESFRNDEFLDAEYAEFLKIVLHKYDYLINLNDFLFNTGILLLKPQYEQWDPEIFLPPLELANQKYPHKYAFTKLLAEVHFKNEDHERALSLLDALLFSVENESLQKENKLIGDKEFTYSDYIDAVQLTGIIHYKFGNFDASLSRLDKVINNLPIVFFNDHKEEDVISYLDSFLTRMSISLNEGKTTDVLRDFERIKEYMYFYDNSENDYPTVHEFLRNQKKI
jgi:tetratricopeptide (TPR) repeat protein